MRLIGWAIALAAAGLTPAAAKRPQARPPRMPSPRAQRRGSASRTPRRAAATPAAAPTAPRRPARSAHDPPTPGIGEPDGRKGLQTQVTPIGRKRRPSTIIGCCRWRDHQHHRPGPAVVGDGPLPPRRQSGASRNSHNTSIEVIWTLVPVLILVAIAIPSIRLLRHTYIPRPPTSRSRSPATNGIGLRVPDYGVTSTATC